jgi:hypothetical protein
MPAPHTGCKEGSPLHRQHAHWHRHARAPALPLLSVVRVWGALSAGVVAVSTTRVMRPDCPRYLQLNMLPLPQIAAQVAVQLEANLEKGDLLLSCSPLVIARHNAQCLRTQPGFCLPCSYTNSQPAVAMIHHGPVACRWRHHQHYPDASRSSMRSRGAGRSQGAPDGGPLRMHHVVLLCTGYGLRPRRRIPGGLTGRTAP